MGHKMANPSNITMFARLTNGNVATPFPGNPDFDEGRVSAHDFIAAIQMWANTEITKAAFIAQFNFTHADDSGDLDLLKGWYDAATKQEKFADVLEWRIILARRKHNAAGTLDLDGAFGYAVKADLIDGADGGHSLKDTGPMPARFNSWA